MHAVLALVAGSVASGPRGAVVGAAQRRAGDPADQCDPEHGRAEGRWAGLATPQVLCAVWVGAKHSHMGAEAARM